MLQDCLFCSTAALGFAFSTFLSKVSVSSSLEKPFWKNFPRPQNFKKLTIEFGLNNGDLATKALRTIPLRALKFYHYEETEPKAAMSVLQVVSDTLEELSIPGNCLVDTDSLPCFHRLTNLEIIGSLDEEKFEKVLLKTPNLTDIDLQSCEVSGDCIMKCLKGNTVRSIVFPENVSPLTVLLVIQAFSGTLEEVKLSYYCLKKLHMDSLPHLAKIKSFDFYGYHHTQRDFDYSERLLVLIPLMPNLEKFSFFFKFSMEKCIPLLINKCPRLHSLELIGLKNSPEKIKMETFQLMHRVRSIMCPFSGVNAAFLSTCKNLESLHLTHVQDTEVALLIHNLKHLKELAVFLSDGVTGSFLGMISSIKRHSPTLIIKIRKDLHASLKSIPSFIVFSFVNLGVDE
eukprot:sb/3465373/